MKDINHGMDKLEEAERALLGAWMLDGVRVGEVLAKLKVKAGWWRAGLRRKLAEGCLALQEHKVAVDGLTLKDWVVREAREDDVEAMREVELCLDACPTAAHAEYYAAILRREYMGECLRTAFQALEVRLSEEDPEMVAAAGAETMRRVLRDNELIRDLTIGEILDQQLDKWRQAALDRAAGKPGEIGVPLPWWRLTKLVGSLPNDLVVLAARPSVGKTALEGMIRVHAASKGYNVLSHLMDMGEERVLPRDACRASGVSMPKLKFGYARKDQFEKVEVASRWLKTLPMRFVTRTTRMELLAMRARHLRAQGKLDLVTVDHCQLMTYAGSERHDMRSIVTRVTSGLKALAQELGIPVILLSQLRRAQPGEAEREPELDDLRDSGSLEQDAAVVMFLHRDAKQVRKWFKEHDDLGMHDKKRPVSLLVKKNQDGGLGRIPLLMYPHYFQFELANGDYEPVRDDDPAYDKEG